MHSVSTSQFWRTRKPYSYSPLSSSDLVIRLVNLLPALNKNEEIHCEISVVSRGDRHHYEALSYTWGDSSKKKLICLNNRPFEVTQNLEIALRALRNDKYSRMFWVDAICIDQTNVTERNSQVMQMRNTYADANKVIIWLEDSDGDVERTVDLLAEAMSPPSEVIDVGDLRNAILPGLQKFLKNPWWTRMWVVQEVAVARSDPIICCGTKQIGWSTFGQAISRLFSDDVLMTSRAFEGPEKDAWQWMLFDGLRQQWQSSQASNASAFNFEELLFATAGCECTDPKDHIFGIVGLLTLSHNCSTRIDYSQSIELIYQRAVVDILNSSDNLDLLTSGVCERNIDLPSWCLDFSVKNWHVRTIDQDNFPFISTNLRASGTIRKSEIQHDPKDGAISLRGTIVGNIVFSVPVKSNPKTDPLNDLDAFAKLSPTEREKVLTDIVPVLEADVSEFSRGALAAWTANMDLSRAREKHDAGDIWQVMAQGDSFQGIAFQLKYAGLFEPALDDLPSDFTLLQSVRGARLRERNSGGCTPAEDRISPGLDLAVRSVIARIAAKLPARATLVTTDTGYIAMANNPLMTGDILCILFGNSEPAVLRPCGHDSYRLISFAYADGINRGEFVQNFDQINKHVFRLV